MVGLRSMNVTELAFHPVDHSSTGHSCLQSERLAQVHMRWVECQHLPTRSLMLDGILGFTETWISGTNSGFAYLEKKRRELKNNRSDESRI